MRAFPATTAVFLRRRMHCPGCHMAAFMTVREAAGTYDIVAEDLLADLRAAAR
jgi:hybrid cluster-associated redox disulfide protein